MLLLSSKACGPSVSKEDIVTKVERICPPLTPERLLPSSSEITQEENTRDNKTTTSSPEWDHDAYFGAISYRALSESLAPSESAHNNSSSSNSSSRTAYSTGEMIGAPALVQVATGTTFRTSMFLRVLCNAKNLPKREGVSHLRCLFHRRHHRGH